MFQGLFQPMHLLVVLGIAVFFFGGKRLPELGKGSVMDTELQERCATN